MASASTNAATTKLILKLVTTFKGLEWNIRSTPYFPDGQRIISGSFNKTTRQWDLKTGKEIEEARDVCNKQVWAVTVSRDGQWVVTGGDSGELKTYEVETGIVKTLEGHSQDINTVDISTNSTLLASGSEDRTAQIWNLETGKLVGGPFKSISGVGAVRFSPDLKKLTIKSNLGTCLEVWDIQSQKLGVRLRNPLLGGAALLPVFWTNKNKTIITAFQLFSSIGDSQAQWDLAKTIYKFDASTLETVGDPFEGHTNVIHGLALSFDGALLASASYYDSTIKLWAFESRQLASFNVQDPHHLIFSPDSRQLVYTRNANNDYKICICDTPPDVLAQVPYNYTQKSNATRQPFAGHRRPPISAIPIAPRPPLTRGPQQPTFLRLRKLLRFSSRANAVHSDRNNQPRDPLDFPATLPLPPNHPPTESSPSTTFPSDRASFNPSSRHRTRGSKRRAS